VPIQKLSKKAKIAPPSSVSRVFFLERKDLKGGSIEVNKEVTPEEIATRFAFVNACIHVEKKEVINVEILQFYALWVLGLANLGFSVGVLMVLKRLRDRVIKK